MTADKSIKFGTGYEALVSGISQILETGRSQAAWTLNSVMSAVYWEIGRRIVEFEQAGKERAGYGEQIIKQLANDLKGRYGGGFGRSSLYQIRAFYLAYQGKVQTLSGQSLAGAMVRTASALSPESALIPASAKKVQTLSGQSPFAHLQAAVKAFPLSWSQYVRLLAVKEEAAREFYETEALRNGWSVRQLDRQIATRF